MPEVVSDRDASLESTTSTPYHPHVVTTQRLLLILLLAGCDQRPATLPRAIARRHFAESNFPDYKRLK